MRPYRHTWLLAGLMLVLGRAASEASPTANMDIWVVDESCSNYHNGQTEDTTGMTGGSDQRPYVQELLDTVLRVTTAAQESLRFVLGKRPDAKTDPDGYQKWIRISKALAATTGIVSKHDEVEKTSDDHWKTLFAIYDKTATTLPAKKNNPEKGYNPTLAALPNGGPLIVCGDNWDWYGKDDDYPGSKTKMRDVPSIKRQLDQGSIGGWYKHHRWAFVNEKSKPIACAPGVMGLASPVYDIIQLCDVAFTESNKADWPSADEIKEGTGIQSITDSPQAILTHELYHWYSGLQETDSDSDSDNSSNNDSEADRTPYEAWNNDIFQDFEDLRHFQFALLDVDRVNEDGYLIYQDSEDDDKEVLEATTLTEDEKTKRHLWIGAAYGVRDVWNLARTHTGEVAANSGPAKATWNAESLTMFSTMMYFDQWDWAIGGKARKPGKVTAS